MNFSRVICLPDLLRGLRVYSEGFFDIIREPIRQASGIDIGLSPTIDKHSLSSGFDLARFYSLANFTDDSSQRSDWASSYYKINHDAVDYLFSYLPENSLVLSLEMPPWLSQACMERGVEFLDMSSSPLRFGRDLYIALRSSSPSFFARIAKHAVLDEEIRLEASLLAASVRMQQRRLEEDGHFKFPCLDGVVLFIGQAPHDASLLTPEGVFLRSTDFAQQLREICQGKRLLYKPHPLSLSTAENERLSLQAIVGQSVGLCELNAYQILSAHHDVQLVGISSGLLQEAKWFDKEAHVLFRPFVPLLSSDEKYNNDGYQQVHFQTFASPAFWHQILAPERPAPRLGALSPIAHHHAREVFDLWWDYSKVITWARTLPYESFMRSGGAQFREKIARLEKKVERAETSQARITVDGSTHDELNVELIIELYSRLTNTYSCIEEVFSKNTSPANYQYAALDAQYYQGLHDNSDLFQSNNWLLPYVEFIRGKEFLSVREVGCGNGAFSSAIAKSVARVVGLDWARSPLFPEGANISFDQQDITTADLDLFDLNCSADVLEHIELKKLPALIEALHKSARFNFHVIACYDDGHSHLSILPPDAWLYLFKKISPTYRIFDISIRHNDASHVVCVVTNL